MLDYDFIVIGLGGLGSVVAHDLAASGARILALDRHVPGHAYGSSHGRSRVIRKAYFEHSDYVPLLKRSYQRWHELEGLTDRPLMDLCGVLEIGPKDGVVVPGVLHAAAQHQLVVQHLNANELRQRFPQISHIDDHEEGVFEPDGGILNVEECVMAWAQKAEQAGAQLRTGTTVLGYSHEGTRWRVVTDSGDHLTKRLILCPGAWAPQLLPAALSEHLQIKRKALFWYASDLRLSRPEGFPVWLFEEPDGVFYGFPNRASEGFKAAEHSGGQLVDHAHALDRSIDTDDQRRLQSFLARRFESVPAENPTDHAVCMYTVTPDEHFIIGKVAPYHDLFVGAGLSGHGFKMVPALGEALAQLARNEAPALSIDLFDPNRFA